MSRTSRASAMSRIPTALLAGASTALALGTLGATATSATAAPDTARIAGQATWYNTGLGACGWNNNDGELVVAVSPGVYGTYPNPNNSPVCGRQLQVNGPLGSVTVTVVDRCAGCATNDVDLSPAAFSRIGDLNAGRINVSWDWL
ncbi:MULTISPECIES: RlpA-like double-psi beta-barrel domain-containing protein [unclassified Streptomyces]|uniref:RlpA-like double-psi beta-barrel domain-containing protein n=1 Tax=unclassified Streptomyces TaxID=2593676 RepID=UPI002E28A317|nr:RlpA-like double-psi beta-barrel domain-containing protein [Streptomyces sp. NBC_01429]